MDDLAALMDEERSRARRRWVVLGLAVLPWLVVVVVAARGWVQESAPDGAPALTPAASPTPTDGTTAPTPRSTPAGPPPRSSAAAAAPADDEPARAVARTAAQVAAVADGDLPLDAVVVGVEPLGEDLTVVVVELVALEPAEQGWGPPHLVRMAVPVAGGAAWPAAVGPPWPLPDPGVAAPDLDPVDDDDLVVQVAAALDGLEVVDVARHGEAIVAGVAEGPDRWLVRDDRGELRLAGTGGATP